jgi:hypothetical protein
MHVRKERHNLSAERGIPLSYHPASCSHVLNRFPQLCVKNPEVLTAALPATQLATILPRRGGFVNRRLHPYRRRARYALPRRPTSGGHRFEHEYEHEQERSVLLRNR